MCRCRSPLQVWPPYLLWKVPCVPGVRVCVSEPAPRLQSPGPRARRPVHLPGAVLGGRAGGSTRRSRACPEAGRWDPGRKMLPVFVRLLPAAPWKTSRGRRCWSETQTAPPPYASNIYSKSTFKGLF